MVIEILSSDLSLELSSEIQILSFNLILKLRGRGGQNINLELGVELGDSNLELGVGLADLNLELGRGSIQILSKS